MEEIQEKNEITEILEFLYYSIIFYIVILFFSAIIDILAYKLFPQDKYILIEIFVIWISLSIMLFYSKKLIYILPNPFTNSTLKNDKLNLLMLIVLVPLIISCSVKNMRNKTQMLYSKLETYFY
jgi:hypothetical protein